MSGSLVKPPFGVWTAWMVRRPVSSRMRLTYRTELYGVSFLPFLLRSPAGAAMRWVCHSWSSRRPLVRNGRRWASRSGASVVQGCCRAGSSSFMVQISSSSCWSVRCGSSTFALEPRPRLSWRVRQLRGLQSGRAGEQCMLRDVSIKQLTNYSCNY